MHENYNTARHQNTAKTFFQQMHKTRFDASKILSEPYQNKVNEFAGF